MNFYDFFIFLTRFFLANLVQLCNLCRDSENSAQSSSPVARHLALNLGSVRNVAFKIKSVGGLAGNNGFFLDISEILDDPSFHNLCMGLEKVYGMIRTLQSCSFDIKKDLGDDFMELNSIRTYGSQVFTAQDLVRFIDDAVAELGVPNVKEIVLPSERDAA